MNRCTYCLILIVLFGCLAVPEGSWGREPAYAKPGPFNSVFARLKKGDFYGSINGVVVLESGDGRQLILDFQGSRARLRIVPDEHEVYDTSYKKYTGLTTSGKTEVFYSTYAMANEIGVVLNNVEFAKSNLDGCSCEAIEGIDYKYIEEEGTNI